MCVSANKTSSRPHWTDSAAAARKAEKCLIRKKLSSPATKTIEYPYICILIWYFKLFLPPNFIIFFWYLDQSHPKIWIDIILSNQTLNAYYTTPSSRVALSAWRLHCIRALFSLENDDTHARKPMSSSSGLRSSKRAGGRAVSASVEATVLYTSIRPWRFLNWLVFQTFEWGKESCKKSWQIIHLKSSLPPLP